jgi:hypothetical protein
LQGPYQVALVEISNFSNIKIQLGKITFKNPLHGNNFYENRKESIAFNLSVQNGIALEQFCNALNYEIENNFIKEEYIYRYKLAYECSEDIVETLHKLNNEKKNQKRPILNILKKNKPIVQYDLIDKLESPFKEKFFKYGAIYDLLKTRYTFMSIDDLKKDFDLIVMTTPPEETSLEVLFTKEYFMDKKSLITEDEHLIENHYRIPRKVVEESQVPGLKLDPQHPAQKAASELAHLSNFWDFYNKENYEKLFKLLPQIIFLNSEKILIQTYNNIEFDGLISKVINNNDIEKTLIIKPTLFYLPANLQLIKYILVYSDIIEAQYFGDVRSAILRTVNLKAQNLENVTFFDNPHYLNVCKTRIETINIEICDINGNHIQFQDFFSNIHIILHFRRKK